MINSIVPDLSSPSAEPSSASQDEDIAAIVRSGPGGAIVVAGLATAIVVALWFAFYLFVFLPRTAAP